MSEVNNLDINVEKIVLPTGSIVDAKWRDGKKYAARIIERRLVTNVSKTDNTLNLASPTLLKADQDELKGANYQYYVHYLRFNRRMDEWINLEDIDMNSIEMPCGDDEAAVKRALSKRNEEMPEDDDHGMFDVQALKDHEEFTKVKNVELIELGKYEMETWYFSPLPEEYRNCKFFKNKTSLVNHLYKSRAQHPPGDEIYRDGIISMFEVDGSKEQNFCQNLAYMAKLFLDHKSLYSDVEIFMFYVMCEVDERGAHIVGYFSKEKVSEEGCNLACILTLPPYQRKGYGKFLISMSYELSKIEGKVGTPERPLSDLGKASYRGYWTRQIIKVLQTSANSISVKELSSLTAIKPDDIRTTLEDHMNVLHTVRGQKAICADPNVINKLLKQAGSPGYEVDPKKIIWSPYPPSKDIAYRA